MLRHLAERRLVEDRDAARVGAGHRDQPLHLVDLRQQRARVFQRHRQQQHHAGHVFRRIRQVVEVERDAAQHRPRRVGLEPAPGVFELARQALEGVRLRVVLDVDADRRHRADAEQVRDQRGFRKAHRRQLAEAFLVALGRHVGRGDHDVGRPVPGQVALGLAGGQPFALQDRRVATVEGRLQRSFERHRHHQHVGVREQRAQWAAVVGVAIGDRVFVEHGDVGAGVFQRGANRLDLARQARRVRADHHLLARTRLRCRGDPGLGSSRQAGRRQLLFRLRVVALDLGDQLVGDARGLLDERARKARRAIALGVFERAGAVDLVEHRHPQLVGRHHLLPLLTQLRALHRRLRHHRDVEPALQAVIAERLAEELQLLLAPLGADVFFADHEQHAEALGHPVAQLGAERAGARAVLLAQVQAEFRNVVVELVEPLRYRVAQRLHPAELGGIVVVRVADEQRVLAILEGNHHWNSGSGRARMRVLAAAASRSSCASTASNGRLIIVRQYSVSALAMSPFS